MTDDPFTTLFSPTTLAAIFPAERADRFFEALLGDAGEGAYDIRLVFAGADAEHLHFHFQLLQRPGKCLSCSVTYGLPHVLARHPVIDVAGVVGQIVGRLNGHRRCSDWHLGKTSEVSRRVHTIPLTIRLENPLPA
jgi:hypothetical protein